MRKTVTFSIGLLLTLTPVLVLAQSTSTTDATIASLQKLIATLTEELQTLLAAKQSSASLPAGMTMAPAPVGTPTAPVECMNYMILKKGDTDATTNGAVSKAQVFFGMSKVTGYYGAQTSLAYQNKCGNLGNAQPTSVAGMSKYTDSDFGFSFWYPSGWSVTALNGSCTTGLGDVPSAGVPFNGTLGKCLRVRTGIQDNDIVIMEMSSPSMSLETNSVNGANPVGVDDKIYFDQNTGMWMTINLTDAPNGTPAGTKRPLDVTNNTMGGLHIFGLNPSRHDYDSVVPLSAQHFLVIDSLMPFSSQLSHEYLVSTIVATNPAVAVPVSTSQQLSTIQAEATAYGVTASGNTPAQSSSLQTYTSSQYGFSLQYPTSVPVDSGISPQTSYTANIQKGSIVTTFGPLTETFRATESGWGDNGVVSATGKLVISVSTDANVVRNCMVAPQAYEQGPSNIQVKQIQGVNFLSFEVDQPAMGLYESDKTYTTVHNGMCYSLDAHIDGGASGHMNTTDATANNAIFADIGSKLDTIAQSFTFAH